MILDGQVLGKVEHYYWKKEYQSRGALLYHVLLWVQDAPVVGKDPPEKVLAWIRERITCHIPDQKNNPELHRMVTRYQLHKCSEYCRRRCYVTSCKFGFPRQAREHAVVHNVNATLKKFQRIYEIERAEREARVNDYNPLLLLTWGANMDIQDVDMAVSTYCSGYVTKHERRTSTSRSRTAALSAASCSRLVTPCSSPERWVCTRLATSLQATTSTKNLRPSNTWRWACLTR